MYFSSTCNDASTPAVGKTFWWEVCITGSWIIKEPHLLKSKELSLDSSASVYSLVFLEAPAGRTEQCSGPHTARRPQFADPWFMQSSKQASHLTPSFLETCSLSSSCLECKAMCIDFFVLWSIRPSTSIVHLKNGLESLMKGTAQVFDSFMRFLPLLFTH